MNIKLLFVCVTFLPLEFLKSSEHSLSERLNVQMEIQRLTSKVVVARGTLSRVLEPQVIKIKDQNEEIVLQTMSFNPDEILINDLGDHFYKITGTDPRPTPQNFNF